MDSIFSARNVTLFVFILVVLFLGATFSVRLGPESFDGAMSFEEEEEESMMGMYYPGATTTPRRM